MSLDQSNPKQVFECDICARACRRMWAAILLQELRLAVRPVSKGKGFYHRNRAMDSLHAREWFASPGFREVAELAGLDPDAVRRALARKHPGIWAVAQ